MLKNLIPENLEQIANSFDPATLVKIIKGAAHSFLVGALTGGVEATFGFLQNVDVGNPLLTTMAVWLMGTVYNAWREYRKGLPASQTYDESAGTQ